MIDVEHKVAIEQMTLNQRSSFSRNYRVFGSNRVSCIFIAPHGSNFLPEYFSRIADTWNWNSLLPPFLSVSVSWTRARAHAPLHASAWNMVFRLRPQKNIINHPDKFAPFYFDVSNAAVEPATLDTLNPSSSDTFSVAHYALSNTKREARVSKYLIVCGILAYVYTPVAVFQENQYDCFLYIDGVFNFLQCVVVQIFR